MVKAKSDESEQEWAKEMVIDPGTISATHYWSSSEYFDWVEMYEYAVL